MALEQEEGEEEEEVEVEVEVVIVMAAVVSVVESTTTPVLSLLAFAIERRLDETL